eukprot:gene16119-16297_t
MSVVKRRFFPDSFKRGAVDGVAASGLSAGAVAKELGVHERVLRRWIMQFGMQATGAARRLHTQNERLRMEPDTLKKAALTLTSPASGTDWPTDEPVRIMCKALGLSASGYYAWRTRPRSARSAANEALNYAILRGRGRRVGRSRVERLMLRAGIRGLAALPRRARTTDSRHGYPIAPNRLARNFRAAPNQVCLADITYIPTGEGRIYLAAILDMHARKIDSWSIRETLHTEIVLDALNMVVERQRPATGLIHHSDRGIQYAAGPIVQPWPDQGSRLRQAARFVGFAALRVHTHKTERVHHRVYATRAKARRDLFGYIVGFYNPRRQHSVLGYISPAHAKGNAT